MNFSNISGLVSRPPLQPFCSGARGQQVTRGTAAGQERKPLVHPCPALPIPLGSHPSLRRQESAAPRLLCQQGIPLLGKREPRKPKLSPKSQASRSAGAVRAPGCRILTGWIDVRLPSCTSYPRLLAGGGGAAFRRRSELTACKQLFFDGFFL